MDVIITYSHNHFAVLSNCRAKHFCKNIKIMAQLNLVDYFNLKIQPLNTCN